MPIKYGGAYPLCEKLCLCYAGQAENTLQPSIKHPSVKCRAVKAKRFQMMDKHILYGMRVICAKQAVDNPWIAHRWVVHDILPQKWEAGNGEVPFGYVPLMPLHQHNGQQGADETLYIADIQIDLHHAEAEAYAENLQSSDPAIYIVLRPTDEDDAEAADDAAAEAEMMLVEVSLSPYHIQDVEDCGEDQVMKVPLVGPMAEFVSEFVETYYRPESFIKRKRDKARIDEDMNRGGDKRIKRAYH